MVDFEARAKNDLHRICDTLESRGAGYCTGMVRVDPDNGHSFAQIYEDGTCILHYRAKGIDELSRQLEAVAGTLTAIGRIS